MLPDMRAAQGPFKNMTQEWFGGSVAWCHTLECEMDSVAQLAIHKAFLWLPSNLPHLHANYSNPK